jgi:glycosyltransferase involved in cell wall biosynthesis
LVPQADSIEAQPAVAVVIPAFNAAAYIGQAVESVLAQTYPACRAIVVNDGSPDTEQLEAALAPYRNRITYLRQENAGPSGARNRGIREATEPLVAFLDADDYWDEEFLLEQVKLITGQGYDLAYSDARCFYEGSRRSWSFMERQPQVPTVSYRSLLGFESMISTSTVVVRRHVALAVGGFDETIGNYAEDFDFYLRVARAGARIGFNRRCFVHHRGHGASLTSRPYRLNEGTLKVLERHAAGSLTPAERAMVERSRMILLRGLNLEKGKQALLEGDPTAAREFLGAAARARSDWKLSLALLATKVSPGLLRRWIRLQRRVVGEP